MELPEVMWVSVRDRTRAPGDLEDQAARYHAERHELTINADFRVFADMGAGGSGSIKAFPAPAERSRRSYGNGSSRRSWKSCCQPAVSAARRTGTADDLTALLSPAALTAAVLPRQLVDAEIKKRLAQKLGR